MTLMDLFIHRYMETYIISKRKIDIYINVTFTENSFELYVSII